MQKPESRSPLCEISIIPSSSAIQIDSIDSQAHEVTSPVGGGTARNNSNLQQQQQQQPSSSSAPNPNPGQQQEHHRRKTSNMTSASVEVGELAAPKSNSNLNSTNNININSNQSGNRNDDEDDDGITDISGVTPGLHNNNNNNNNNTGNVFGPHRSTIAMLKQLRFSPFVATHVRSNGINYGGTTNNNGNGNNNDDDANSNGSSDGFTTSTSNQHFARPNGGAIPTSPWQFFTPGMTKYHSILSYIVALIMFACSVTAIVARYKTKPNDPIVCDSRLDQALSWLGGLMMPSAILVPVWTAIFLQHVYPSLYQASRVPLERTFRQFNFFVAYSSFLAILMVAIFGSCLYALSVAKSWDFVESAACGDSFTMLRSIAIIGIVTIGLCAVAQFFHWTYLNSKLEKARGIVRPIPGTN